jgi:Nucleotidyltransferase domain
MRRQEANAVIDAIGAWAIRRDDIRAMALVGSWARGNPHRASDIDVLLLTDNAGEYRRRRTWLCEIDFRSAGYRLHSTKTTFLRCCLVAARVSAINRRAGADFRRLFLG